MGVLKAMVRLCWTSMEPVWVPGVGASEGREQELGYAMEQHLQVILKSPFHAGTGKGSGQGQRWLWACSNISPLVLCLGHRQHKEEFSYLFKLSQIYSPHFSLAAPRLKLLQGSCLCLAVVRAWQGRDE